MLVTVTSSHSVFKCITWFQTSPPLFQSRKPIYHTPVSLSMKEMRSWKEGLGQWHSLLQKHITFSPPALSSELTKASRTVLILLNVARLRTWSHVPMEDLCHATPTLFLHPHLSRPAFVLSIGSLHEWLRHVTNTASFLTRTVLRRPRWTWELYGHERDNQMFYSISQVMKTICVCWLIFLSLRVGDILIYAH